MRGSAPPSDQRAKRAEHLDDALALRRRHGANLFRQRRGDLREERSTGISAHGGQDFDGVLLFQVTPRISTGSSFTETSAAMAGSARSCSDSGMSRSTRHAKARAADGPSKARGIHVAAVAVSRATVGIVT